MKIERNGFLSIEQLQDQYLNSTQNVSNGKKAEGISFEQVLAEKLNSSETTAQTSLKFSKHAVNRLMDRNITLSDTQMERLSDGTQKANEKGIKESLVVVDQLAFIVNVPNKTVITAMDQTETKDNIFTNIDGAVFI